jgi:hypothetical protein
MRIGAGRRSSPGGSGRRELRSRHRVARPTGPRESPPRPISTPLSRHRAKPGGSVTQVRRSAVARPGFLNRDWRSGFADSNPLWFGLQSFMVVLLLPGSRAGPDLHPLDDLVPVHRPGLVNGHSWLEKQIPAANCSSRSVVVPVGSFGRGDGVWSIVRSAEADPETYSPVASESSSVGSGERPGPVVPRSVVASTSAGPRGAMVVAWRVRQRGQRPAGASADSSAPQLGHRFESAATGRLHRARGRPRSAGYDVEARSESSVASGELSHKPWVHGYLPVPRAPRSSA